MNSSGKAGKLYEVFYIKKGVTQYFIKPLKLKSEEITVLMDFTLKSNLTNDEHLTCNFSIFSEKPIKKINNFLLNNKELNTPLLDLEKIFLEKDKKKYHLRYTSKLTFQQFSNLTKSKYSLIKVDGMELTLTKSTLKKLNKINSSVVELIELNFED